MQKFQKSATNLEAVSSFSGKTNGDKTLDDEFHHQLVSLLSFKEIKLFLVRSQEQAAQENLAVQVLWSFGSCMVIFFKHLFCRPLKKVYVF